MGCSRLSERTLPTLAVTVLVATCAVFFASSASAAGADADTSPPPPPKVLILDLKSSGVDVATVKTLNGILPTIVGEVEGLDVVSGEDLTRMMELEAERQVVGCDTESCLAEIAGALGAEYVLFGNVGSLGGSLIVNLSLFDSAKGAAISRTLVEVDDARKLTDALRPKVRDLLRPVARTAPPVLVAGGDVEGLTTGLYASGAILAGLGILSAGAATVGYWVAHAGAEASGALAFAALLWEGQPVALALGVGGAGILVVGGGLAAAGFVLSSSGEE